MLLNVAFLDYVFTSFPATREVCLTRDGADATEEVPKDALPEMERLLIEHSEMLKGEEHPKSSQGRCTHSHIHFSVMTCSN